MVIDIVSYISCKIWFKQIHLEKELSLYILRESLYISLVSKNIFLLTLPVLVSNEETSLKFVFETVPFRSPIIVRSQIFKSTILYIEEQLK